MKKLLARIVFGFEWGCVAFVAALFAGSAAHGGANAFVSRKTGEGLIKTAIFCIILAISGSIAGMIHEVRKLSFSLKVLFQMTVWTIVFLLGAYVLGWIEKNGIKHYILTALGISAITWLLCMALSLMSAHKMNQKIKERKRKDNNKENREAEEHMRN